MNEDLTNAMKRERKFQDKKYSELSLTHLILQDEELSDDEKFIRLITECHFGKQRAQELVYGKVIYQQSYQSAPLSKDFSKYYKKAEK